MAPSKGGGKYAKASRTSIGSTAELLATPSSVEIADIETPSVFATPGTSAADRPSHDDEHVVIVKPNWRKRWWNAIVEATGALAGMATTAAFIPQVYQIYQTGDTSGLSLSMYTIFVTGVFLWIVYGVCKKAGSLILANLVTFCLAGFILFKIVQHAFFDADEGSSSPTSAT